MNSSNFFNREILLLGEKNFKKLQNSKAAVFGLGGVGSFAAEALARSGIGELHLFDCDIVDITNTNRQLYALSSTIGKKKTDVAYQRILEINPTCKIYKYDVFLTPENITNYISDFDFAVDAIDTVETKIELIKQLKDSNITFISSMGSANKTDPSEIQINFLEKTSVCPLARIVRKEMKKCNLKKIPVVYSTEKKEPVTTDNTTNPITGKRPLGTSSYIPPIFGMMCASFIIRSIIEEDIKF